MARIQQSVDIKASARVAYNQLTQFEDYPRFMREVESARQTDDTHVLWTTRIGQQAHEWTSEIVEQQRDRCIAWRNVDGPVRAGRVDVEAVDDDSARVTFTLEADAIAPGAEGADAMARQVQEDLQRLKRMIESTGHETGAWRGEVDGSRTADGQVNSAGSGTQAGNRPHQSAAGYGDVATNEAMKDASQEEQGQASGKEQLDASIKRAVPPSN